MNAKRIVMLLLASIGLKLNNGTKNAQAVSHSEALKQFCSCRDFLESQTSVVGELIFVKGMQWP